MIKKIRLCLLISIISLYSSLPSLAMDQDEEVRNRITRKIEKYEIKVRDLRRLLENFQISQRHEVPSSPHQQILLPTQEEPQETTQNQIININLQDPITPIRVPQQILPPRQINHQEITIDIARNTLRLMYNDGRGRTYAEIGELLDYAPDKLNSTPNGKSTGKSAVWRFINGESDSPSVLNKFKEKVRTGAINLSLPPRQTNYGTVGTINSTPQNHPQPAEGRGQALQHAVGDGDLSSDDDE